MNRVDKPWGYEEWWAKTEHYLGKLLYINKGEELSLQLHREKDETCKLLSGDVSVLIGSVWQRFHGRYGSSAWRVKPKVIHKIIAHEDSVIVEVSTPQAEDVVRIEDKYGRN